MEALLEFLAMGGHGHFVWGSYLLSALVLGGLFLLSRRALGRSERELEALKARLPERRARTGSSA